MKKLFLFLSFLAFFNVFAQGTTGSIIITINDSGNQPLSGVNVALKDPVGAVVVTKATDAAGKATFSGLASVGDYTYAATKTCYTSFNSQKVTYDGQNDITSTGIMKSVALLDKTVTKVGNVLTSNEATPGATYSWTFNGVTISSSNGGTNRVYKAYTPGIYKVNVGCTATPMLSDDINVTATDAPVSLNFTIKDIVTQTAIAGASVNVTNTDLKINLTTTTNASGNVVFIGLPTANYTCTFTNSCYAKVVQTVIYDGQNTVNVNGLMKASKDLSNVVTQVGNVLTAAEDTPNVSYSWYLNGTVNTSLFTRVVKAPTPGTYKVTITSGSGCAVATSSDFVVAASDAPNLTIILKDQANAAIANQNIKLTPSTSTTGITLVTDANGKAVFLGLPSDTYTCTATKTCFTSINKTITYDGQTDPNLSLQMLGSSAFVATVTTAGNVLTADETNPLALFKWSLKSGTTYTAISGATSKTYTVNVPGTYQLTVGPTSTCATSPKSADIVVDTNASTELLTIGVMDDTANAKAIPGVTVTLTSGTTTMGTATTDANGMVAFIGLTSGTNYGYNISNTCYNAVSGILTYFDSSDFLPVNLSSRTFKSTVTRDGLKLTADENVSGVKYQWTKLNTTSGLYENITISGTSQSYTVTTTGTYRVDLSVSGCANVSGVTHSDAVVINDNDIPHNVTFTVTDGTNPVPNANISVYKGGVIYLSGDFIGSTKIFPLPPGNYTYKVSQLCYNDLANQPLTVGNVPKAQVISLASVQASLTNNLTAVVLSGVTGIGGGNLADFTINIKNAVGNNASYNQTKISGSSVAEVFTAIPYGDYVYTVSKDCYATKTGTITIGCNDGLAFDLRVTGVTETVNDIDKTVTRQGNVLTANAIGNYTYQWLDCNNSNTPIENATSRTYTAAVAGNYSVKITNACSVNVTSDCIEVLAHNVTIAINDGTSPISGAQVVMSTVPATTKTTDANGKVTFSLIDGSYTYNVSSVCYQDVVNQQVNVNGADIADIAKTLILKAIDNTVTQQANVLTANATGDQYGYQWYNCNNSTPVEIENAKSRTYAATVAGKYSVVITNTVCSTNVTSDCIEVTEASLGLEQNAVSVFTVYPNPVIDNLVLQMNNDFQNVSIEVVNMQGQIVGKSVYSGGTNHKMDLSGLASGLYILNVTADQMHATQRIIKK